MTADRFPSRRTDHPDPYAGPHPSGPLPSPGEVIAFAALPVATVAVLSFPVAAAVALAALAGAVVGAVVTGDTDHDRVIADTAAQKLSEISLDRDTPVTFGVAGPGMSGAEARERVEKGAEAVNAAVDLLEVLGDV